MDQVKKILFQIFRYRFWILCPIVIGATFGTWFVATDQLSAEATTNRGKWESAFGVVTTVKTRGVDTSGGRKIHPNDVTSQKTQELIAGLTEEIKKAWHEQYQAQEEILVWPSRLSDEFREAVDPLRPIETSVPYPTPRREELERNFRAEYRDFIKTHLPNLASIVGAVWHLHEDECDAPGPGDEDWMTDKDYVVEWVEEDQSRLQKQLAIFPGQEDQDNRPTTLQMLYAQEDLWVLESLLRVIKATNGDAERHFQASVRRIDAIELGRYLKASKSSVRRAGTEQATGTVTGAVSFLEADTADKRYVDKEYNPLSGDELRESYESTDPERAYLSVAKRMPVRLRLTMDQRRIDRLLVECANSPLTLEVRQVRINAEGDSFTRTSRQSGQFGGTFGGSSSSRSTNFEDETKDYPFDIPVEIYGVVYIYNPQRFGEVADCDCGIDCCGDECAIDECACDACAGDECAGDDCACDACAGDECACDSCAVDSCDGAPEGCDGDGCGCESGE